jgi:uncharacterized cupin superfamily protein
MVFPELPQLHRQRSTSTTMLYPLRVPGSYAYSEPSANGSMVANSYLVTSSTGETVLFDPLPDQTATLDASARLGNISKIVVMSAQRTSAAHELAERCGAQLITVPQHLEPIASGMFAILLPDQRRDAEFAVNIADRSTVVVGDAVQGSPAGALSMADASEYSDARRAALSLRRILRENPQTLLVSFGQSLFADAYDALYELLHGRAGAEIHRINLDELEFRDERDEHSDQPPQFACLDAEVGFAIGARKLGYRVSVLAPGQRFCPLHAHAREEELFLVIDGEPSVRMPAGTIRCRKGDFVALPVGDTGTHQLLNESAAPATVMLLARNERVEACYYPDSDKLLVDSPAPLGARTSIMVAAHPDLDYFHGER